MDMKKKLTYSVLTVITLSMLLVQAVSAQGVVLDGVIDEEEYTLYLYDDTHAPIYSLFTANDTDYFYFGIILEGDNDASNDIIELAFRQLNVDFWIQDKGGVLIFRPSGGSWQDWWANKRDGLPESIQIAVGETKGETSYEIRITRSVLGKYGDDFPASFRLWLKINGDVNGVNYNNYPENDEDWWFYKENKNPRILNVESEEVPKFHVPEVPYGSVLTLVSMAAALAIASKKPLFKS
jgi:hypothetical protein